MKASASPKKVRHQKFQKPNPGGSLAWLAPRCTQDPVDRLLGSLLGSGATSKFLQKIVIAPSSFFVVLFLYKKAQDSARFTVAVHPGPSPHLRIAGLGGGQDSRKFLSPFSLAREHIETRDSHFANLRPPNSNFLFRISGFEF